MLWGDQHAAYSASAGGVLDHQAGEPITTTINGVKRTINSGQDKTLLRFLREDARLPGRKRAALKASAALARCFSTERR